MATKLPPEVDVQSRREEKKAERFKLIGSTDEAKPRTRSPREIIAKYRKAVDAYSAAAYTRHKLAERHEKLEKISKDTQELDGHSEDYEDLAKELQKRMEKRKWWQL